MAQCVYICRRGHTGRYLTVIDEQGNKKGEVWVRRGSEKKKSVRKAGYLLSLKGGFPREGGGGRRGCVGERPGFIEKKNTACLA